MTHPFPASSLCALAFAAASSMLPTPASALTPAQAYRLDAAACMSQQATQARSDCLYEARSVRRDALAGLVLPVLSAQELDSNALIRCRSQPADARVACERMTHGAGSREGSVADGAVLKELVTRTTGPAPVARP